MPKLFYFDFISYDHQNCSFSGLNLFLKIKSYPQLNRKTHFETAGNVDNLGITPYFSTDCSHFINKSRPCYFLTK